MKRLGNSPAMIGRVGSLAIALFLVLSALPAFEAPVAAQETVSVTVTTTAADGTTPMPFTRVRATSSDGTIYGPLETGLPGSVSFQIDLTSPEMTVSVDVETPPACGVAPEPQVIGPFTAGETVGVNFAISTDSNCNLGALAVYAYDCPDGFDATATNFEAWRDGCAEERNNVQFTFTMDSTGQTWNPVTGEWGIAGRAPIVGLPPGAYSIEETNPAPDQDSVFYCYTYATPDHVTSPNPTSIDRVEATDGAVTVNLNANRISCDVFQVDAAPDTGDEPGGDQPGGDQGPDDGPGDLPTEIVGTATTNDEVNLRDASNLNSNVIAVLQGGTQVGILGEPENGFYPVSVNAQSGWVSAEFLDLEGAPDQPTETTQPDSTATETPPIAPVDPISQAVTISDVNFRDAPDANSNVLSVLPGGTQVGILGEPQNGFYPVSVNDQPGWVSGEFLDLDGVDAADETNTPTATNTPDALATATAWPIDLPATPLGTAITNDSVNFRNGPSSEAAVLFELPADATVDIFGAPQNGFYPVRYQDQTGWVSEIFLDIQTATETATSEPTVTPQVLAPIGIAFTTSDVNMRESADPTSNVLTVLLPNTQVEVLGPEENGFVPVRYEGQDGYVSAQFLSIGGPPSPTATSTSETGVAAEDPVRLELHKSVCEPGYVPADGATIFEDCHADGVDNVTFFVDGPEDFSTQGMTSRIGGVGPGIAVFEALPAGDLTINEDVPGDSTSIWVFCSMADSDQVVPFTYNDGIQGIDISLAAGQSVVCDWYNIPDDQGQPAGFLEFHKATCDEGYIPGDSIREDCHGNGLANVNFFIEGPNEYANQGTTTIPQDPGPGIVRFDNLEAGVYTINEDVPGDFTSIYVHCELADSPDLVNFSYVEDIQGIQIELTEGMQVICDWYNIPDVQPADEGTASIEMHKALCPPGFDPESGIYDACHGQGLAGVDFTVNGPNGYSQIGATVITQTPGPGIVKFSALDAGAYSVSENFSDESTSIYVYCSLANSQTQIPFSYNQSGGIDISLADGQAVICDWYNIPDEEEEDGLVILHKRTCPVGYDHDSADFDDFFEDCTSRTNDVTFTLTPDGGTAMTRDTGDDGNGRAVFTGLEFGDYTLSEDLPGEFVNRYAYCGVDDRNLSATPVVNGSVDLTLSSENPQAVCLWFNSPEDLSGLTGQISLTKFLCPEGTTSNYWQNCSDAPLSGATFHLNGPGENDGSQVTGNNGYVIFDDLPAGNYTIQEVPPAGTQVAVYVVACQAGGAAYKFTYDDSDGMKIKLNLPIEGEIHCNWYNIPPKKHLPPPPVSTGKGTITVHKFLCTGKAINQYDWESDCLVQTSPEGFSLETLTGTQLAQGTTNTGGIIIFTGLNNGSYKLDETTGDWCHAEADFVDAAGNLIVKNGGNTDVFIYNCGARQVGTLPVTGSGDTALGNASADLFMPAAGALATLIVLMGLSSMQRRPRSFDA